ncbi:MAG: PorT family protein [Muribaculaceae bacterium]|nr:PorT family protein [Muribaculaceae bacterium]
MRNFKHLIIVALVAIFACGQANAEFRFGVKAGANFNKLHLGKENISANFASENRAGFTAGVMTEFTVPIIGIGADLSLMYSHMNNELKEGTTEGTVGKNFLEIPLNLKYKFSLPVVSKFVKPMIFTGPTFAFKLDKSVFNAIKTKTTQVGWNFGIGVEFLNHLQISGGYTLGINNVLKYSKYIPAVGGVTDNLNLVKLKNNYWTVTAAYLF